MQEHDNLPGRKRSRDLICDFADRISVDNRRKEFRSDLMARILVRWTDQAGNAHAVPAVIEDKSASGACIRLIEEIPLKTLVKIEGPNEQFAGTVMNCRRNSKSYLVGIERTST